MKPDKEFEPAVGHEAAVIEELRADPAYAKVYLQTACDEMHEKGGVEALSLAVNRVSEAGRKNN